MARMTIQAAQRMGLRCLSLDPEPESPAAQVADSLVGKLDDTQKIYEVTQSCQRVTLENEFIPAGAIEAAMNSAENLNLVPNLMSLDVIQDKLIQRFAFQEAGVPSPRAVELDDGGATAIKEIGFPMVLKSRIGGYDGKGTRYARSEDEFNDLKPEWEGKSWLAEEYVPFNREIAAMVYISEWGAGCFPTMETIQTNHVCDLVFPAGIDASNIAMAAVEAVGGNGLYGVEMFELESGEIKINEIAPRPHNTGHYTLDWGSISQFEQHVRVAMGFPLIHPEGYRPVCMANLLGREGPFDLRHALTAAMSDPTVHVHWYGKKEMRPGRKMGHLNVVGHPGEPVDALVEKAKKARERFFSS